MKRLRYIVGFAIFIVGMIFAIQSLQSQNINNSNNTDVWLTNYIEPSKEVSPDLVYTFLCELITQKPETLTNTCADFGESVYMIKWKTWGVKGATGTGTYAINQCEPNCAQGKTREVPVKLRLDRVTSDGKRYLLNFLTIISDNATEPDGVYAIWDLSSFYREVPDMRSN